jgi:hypothetical protein
MNRPTKIDKATLPYIEYLEQELKKYTESTYLTAYLANRKFMDDNCFQIQNNTLDYSAAENKPIWETRHKFLTEIQPYLENDEFLRNKMTPEQQKEAQKQAKIDNLGIAEKLALNSKNGK